MRKLRAKQKENVVDDPSRRMKRCTKCLRMKPYSAFSKSKVKARPELNKLCDACISKLYISQKKYESGFTDVFWRKRAYAVNTSHRNLIARQQDLPYSSVQIKDLNYICKPVDLVKLFNTQHGKCIYCGVVLNKETLSVDHIIPKSRGGMLHINNLCLCCSDCNSLKKQRTKDEFITFLQMYATRITNRSLE